MASSKPLKGYCVVEVGNSVAGPYAGLILAELGADVIKVEAPEGGDFARSWGPPFWDGAAPHFVALNRNKSAITADLGDPDRARRACDTHPARRRRGDLQSAPGHGRRARSRPGRAASAQTRARLQRHRRVRARRPVVVQARIRSADAGVRRSHEHHGRGRDRPPIRVPVSIIDMGSGMWAAIGILASLIEREKTGRGGLVETSLFETRSPTRRASSRASPSRRGR